MKDSLTKEEVLHVARLARIEVSEEEIEKYRVQLKELLNEVEKINDVKGYDESLMITPTIEEGKLRKDESGEMIPFAEFCKNAPKSNGNFIEVPVMIDE